MGVFIAQALTVLLGMAVLLLSLALLALLTKTARRENVVRVHVELRRSRGSYSATDCSLRRQIERGSAAPSRAPPSFPLRSIDSGRDPDDAASEFAE
jgi:hypothetical protein